MELTSACGEDTLQLIEKNGLAFPFSMYMDFELVLQLDLQYSTNSPKNIMTNTAGERISLPECTGC